MGRNPHFNNLDKSKLKYKFIKGNKKAFNLIYKSLSNEMYAIALRYTKNTDEAADILQEAFIKVFEKRNQFNPDFELKFWIKKIVINTAINHFRKNKKVILIGEDTYFDEADEPIEINTIPNIGKILTDILQQLPDGYRMVFNLYVMENLTHQEIANYLNISENTSKSQLSRAKKLIRQLLEEKNISRKKNLNEQRA